MGVGARTHGSEVTRLGATDLGFEVPGHAQQAILGGVDVAGTLEPQILAPSSAPRSVAPTLEPWISAVSSEPWILAPSMDSKPTAKFPLLRLLSCIISENILRSRQALDSAFSVFGFDVRKAKFQTDP